MTREAELRKEVENITKIENDFSSVPPKEIKRITSKAICLFGDKDLRQILRISDSNELKAITETNSKWKQAIQKTLKELKDEVRHNVFEVELSNGINGVLKDAKVMYEFIDTTFKQNFGGLAE